MLKRRERRFGVFVKLAGAMALLGVIIGIIFPFFSVLLGVPAVHVLSPLFFIACLIAGLLLAASNWWLAQRVVGSRLRRLSAQLRAIAADVREAAADGRWSARSAERFSSQAEGDDELARTAVAFNDLLDTLHEEHRFRSLVQAGADMTCLVDKAGLVTFISSSITEVLGWPPDRALGRPIQELLHPDDADRLTEGDSGPVIVRMIAADGTWHHLEVTCRDHRGDVTIGTLVITARDVSERHALQQRLAHQSAHDQLTGLPNRTAVLAAGAELLSASGEPVAVLMLDLDRFKEINDTLGHTYGDRLLHQVGPRLRTQLRESDILARLGGDEFAVLLPGLGQESAAGRRAPAARHPACAVHRRRAGPRCRRQYRRLGQRPAGGRAGRSAARSRHRHVHGQEPAIRGARSTPSTATRTIAAACSCSPRSAARSPTGSSCCTTSPRCLWPMARCRRRGARAVAAPRPAALLSPAEFIPIAERTGLIHQLTLTVVDLAMARPGRGCPRASTCRSR